MSNMRFRLEGEPRKEPRLYETCGLPNVYLVNGYTIIKRHGEEFMAVADVHGLHLAIARHLVLHRKTLSSNEVRFIRKAMDMTQAELGAKLGVSSQAVARWEKNLCEMLSPADKLLRAVFLATHPQTDDDLKVLRQLLINVLDELDEQDEPEDKQASFELNETWTMLKAA